MICNERLKAHEGVCKKARIFQRHTLFQINERQSITTYTDPVCLGRVEFADLCIFSSSPSEIFRSGVDSSEHVLSACSIVRIGRILRKEVFTLIYRGRSVPAQEIVIGNARLDEADVRTRRVTRYERLGFRDGLSVLLSVCKIPDKIILNVYVSRSC